MKTSIYIKKKKKKLNFKLASLSVHKQIQTSTKIVSIYSYHKVNKSQ